MLHLLRETITLSHEQQGELMGNCIRGLKRQIARVCVEVDGSTIKNQQMWLVRGKADSPL